MHHIKVNLETVRRAARAKAPYTAIPYCAGEHWRIVLRSQMLRTFLTCPFISRAEVVLEGDKPVGLRLTGTEYARAICGQNRRAEYTLKDVPVDYRIREELQAWARTQRKTRATRAEPIADKRTRKLTEAIAKLARERKRIADRTYRPHNHILPPQRETSNDYTREQEWRWREAKPIRRALSRLAMSKWHGKSPLKTWADFYREVARITGQEVSEYDRHDRVCPRKHGPSRFEYFEHIYKYVTRTRKPDYYLHTPEQVADSHALHRDARIKYAHNLRLLAEIDGQIAQHRAEVDAYNAARQHAEQVEHERAA